MSFNIRPIGAVVASLVLLSACQQEVPQAGLPESVSSQASAVPVVEAASHAVVTEVPSVAASAPITLVATSAVVPVVAAAKDKVLASVPAKAVPPVAKVEPLQNTAPVIAPTVPVVAVSEPKAAEAKPQVASSDADALALAKKNNCFACHAIDKKLVGPAWKDVAAKYRGDASAEARIATKIAKGGSGVWGAVGMPSNSKMSEAERVVLAKFVLNLK